MYQQVCKFELILGGQSKRLDRKVVACQLQTKPFDKDKGGIGVKPSVMSTAHIRVFFEPNY